MIKIIVDNLDIGGVQRLALDEFYYFTEKGEDVEIISMSQLRESSILKLDRDFSLFNKVKTRVIDTNRLVGIGLFWKLFRSSNTNLLITHSLSSCFQLRIALFLSRKKIPLLAYVHQSIGLSTDWQKRKRLMYSLLCTEIVFGSHNFAHDWAEQVEKNWFSKRILKKRYTICPIGIYIPRITELSRNNLENCDKGTPHFIFASRITGWKGFSKFAEICNATTHSACHVVVMTASNSRLQEISKINRDPADLHLIYDSQPAAISNYRNSIHFYPTNYGNKVSRPLTVGLNVFEFLALGIPSLISVGGLESYPALEGNMLLQQVDWMNDNEVAHAISLSSMMTSSQIETARLLAVKAVSIESHAEFLRGKKRK